MILVRHWVRGAINGTDIVNVAALAGLKRNGTSIDVISTDGKILFTWSFATEAAAKVSMDAILVAMAAAYGASYYLVV